MFLDLDAFLVQDFLTLACSHAAHSQVFRDLALFASGLDQFINPRANALRDMCP